MSYFTDGSPPAEVGVRLRELRTERGLSMRALARASGLSTNALSMIERARTSPSVSTLSKIAGALNIPITAFFRVEPARQEVVFQKKGEHNKAPFDDGEWLSLGGELFNGGLEPLHLNLYPDASSGPSEMIHTGQEFVTCLEGRLEYQVEEQRYILEPGDSLIFAGRLPHQWRNLSPGETTALVVLAGFEHGERPSEFHLSTNAKQEGEDQPEG
jgi:transcriptional regulator with XRE-family HTH domain